MSEARVKDWRLGRNGIRQFHLALKAGSRRPAERISLSESEDAGATPAENINKQEQEGHAPVAQ